jgi:mannose-1-phosphate guanylyltransferase
MEKSNDVVCIPIDIGWSDIGSFDSLMELLIKNKDNYTKGVKYFHQLDSKNNLILSFDENFDLNLIDITDSIIVKDNNRLLIMKKGTSGKIKQLLKLKEKNE